MKKVLSYVLALAMVLSSFSMAFAATPATDGYSDIAGEPCAEAVTVLSSLGVIAGYTDGTYKPENTVTRAEMAKLVVVALGLEDFVGKTSSGFTDMVGNWADGYVGYAVSLGIVKGYGDGRFGPNDTVTYDQSITMIVRALGYTDNAKELVGTWPAAHVVLAKSLGITDDITLGGVAGANRGDVAIMLNNALDCNLKYIDADGNTQNVTANGTMLARLGVTAVAGGLQVITPDMAGDAIINIDDYIGYKGIPYENSDDEIVAILDKTGTAYDVEISNQATNKVDYDGDTYTLAFTAGTSQLINNKADNNAAAFNLADVTFGADEDITVVGKMSGSTITVYSTIDWDADETYLVDDADLADIEDMDDSIFGSTTVPYTDDDQFDYNELTVVGDATTMDGIQEDDIVTVYYNGTELVRVEVSRDIVEGTVTKVNTDGDKFTVGGKVYEVVANTIDAYDAAIMDVNVIGSEVKLSLDYAGDIVIAEEISGLTDDYALVIGTDPSSGFAADQIKVITKEGEVLTLDVDATDVTDITGNVTAFANITSGAIILYSTNSSGTITEIEVQTPSALVAGAAMSSKGVYNGKIASADTIVFSFEDLVGAWGTGTTGQTGSTASDDYDTSSFDAIKDSTIPNSYYIFDGSDILAMVVDSTAAGSGDDVYGVVTGYSNVIDADDVKVYEVTALVNGKEVTYTTNDRSDAFTGYLTGAAFAFNFDGAGVVTSVDSVATDANLAELGAVDFSTVTAINSGKTVISTTNGSFDIADDAVVYVVTFDDDDIADGYTVGSVSNLVSGAQVRMYTNDVADHATTADIIVVVKRTDVGKTF